MDQARRIADATPDGRNRYVDFLRAVSILAVVVGHWLIAAPYATSDGLQGVNMLAHSPWTQWLTWVFQVMPVFFAVGGYSNTASWDAASGVGRPYGAWLAARVRRLTIPLIPLIGFWALLGVVASAGGIDRDLLELGSQAALIPVWFLAVYVVITAISPLLIETWNAMGWRTYGALAIGAITVDLIVAAGVDWLGWINFLFVWAAIHQLGVAWRSGSLTGRAAGLVALIAGAVTVGLVASGQYPIAMVGVPGAEASNNSPPTLAMIAFGTMQVATLLSFEARARRLLDRPEPWTATVFVNGSIMTLYLWHMTAMVLGIGGMLLLDGRGLNIEPSTPLWWLSRPVWIAALLILTTPFLAILGRFEQVGPMDPEAHPRASVVLAATFATSLGLALLAGGGVQGWFLGIRLEALALAVAAALSVARYGARRPGSTPSRLG